MRCRRGAIVRGAATAGAARPCTRRRWWAGGRGGPIAP
ncbi:hypothetical protein LG3211_3714 [Lysobacter gummosus]|nr:hypothetical protein LG3211_3714 [Lysobacter gummosus]